MLKKTTWMLLLLSLLSAHAVEPPVDRQRLADIIWRVEGGAKTRYPYGIKSVRVRDAAHAREVCLRTIDRAVREWREVGHVRVPCFVEYLAMRYCPPEVDPVGNRNWIRNVRLLIRAQSRPRRSRNWET